MSDTFNWQLKPAPGFPGYQPPKPPASRPGMEPDDSKTTVDGQPLTPPRGPQAPDYSNEPYIPSRDRPHSEWGDDDWAMQGARGYPGVLPGPFMPQPREFASLLHGITMGMGRWGSHYSGMPAIAMGTYASAYWKAYQSGMKERAGQAWQQYRQAHQMFLDRQKEELQAAREGYALYGDNPDKLHQYMMGLASKYHDDNLTNALANDPAHVEELWKYRDSKWRDAGKIKEQQDRRKIQDDILREHYRDLQERRQREEERRKELERLRRQYEDPNAVGPGPDYRPEPLPPAPTLPATEGDAAPAEGGEEGADVPADAGADADTEAPPGGATAEGAPDEAGGPQKPIQVADASGQVPIGGGRTAPPSPARGFGEGLLPPGKPETDPIERSAKDYLWNKGKLPPGLEKNLPSLANRIAGRAGQYRDWLDRLESDPNIDPSSIIPAVKKVFPELGDALQQNVDGRYTMTAAVKNSEFGRRLNGLTEKVAPGFNPGTFASRQKALQYWSTGDGGKTVTSLGMTEQHIQTLLDALPNRPYRGTGFIDKYIYPIQHGEISRFEAYVNAINKEFERALAGKGGTIPELAHASEELNLNMTDEAIIKNLEGRRDLLRSRLDQLKGQFVAGTGFPSTDLAKRFESFTLSPEATDEDRTAAGGLHRIEKWRPGISKIDATGTPQQEKDSAKEGDRKQFKQGWGVFRNGKWVPE